MSPRPQPRPHTGLTSAVLAVLLTVGLAGPLRAELTDEETDLMLQALVDLEILQPMEKVKPAKRREEVEAALARIVPDAALLPLVPRWMAWAKQELAEGDAGWVGQRTVVLLSLGPPGGIHREAARAWNERVPRFDSALDLKGRVETTDPETAARTMDLSGTMPTEIWVYPSHDPNRLRVIWFVDDDGDGTYRYAKDAVISASQRVSEAPRIDLPASLYPSATGTTAERVADPPALDEDVLQVAIHPAMLKAPEGKTRARLAFSVATVDIELELDAEPAAFLRDAEFWVRFSQGDQVVFQARQKPTEEELAGVSEYYLAEVGVPLRPGRYDYVVLLRDSKGRGGRADGTLDVPVLDAGLALSTVVVAKAEGSGDAAALPKAPGGEEPVPFQIGNYVVRPHVSGIFSPGDTLALVVQVYNAERAELDYTLLRDGRRMGGLDPVDVKSLPSTEVQLIPVGEWPAGSYSFVVSADGPGGATVTQEAQFRVKG